jgi:hypothetical protein
MINEIEKICPEEGPLNNNAIITPTQGTNTSSNSE